MGKFSIVEVHCFPPIPQKNAEWGTREKGGGRVRGIPGPKSGTWGTRLEAKVRFGVAENFRCVGSMSPTLSAEKSGKDGAPDFFCESLRLD